LPYLSWGDFHTNIHGEDSVFKSPPLTRDRLKRIMKAAKEHLDFFAVAYYPFVWDNKNDFIIESVSQRERFLKDWKLF